MTGRRNMMSGWPASLQSYLRAGTVQIQPGTCWGQEDRSGKDGILRYWVRSNLPVDVVLTDNTGYNNIVDRRESAAWDIKKQRTETRGEVAGNPFADWYLVIVNRGTQVAEVEYTMGWSSLLPRP